MSHGATGGEFKLAVMDEAQDLFHANAARPDFLEVQHELRENFRNSPQIAAFAARVGDVEMDCLADDGPPVQFVAVPSNRVVAEAEAVARRLQRTERFAARDLAVMYLFHNPRRHHSDEAVRAYGFTDLAYDSAAT